MSLFFFVQILNIFKLFLSIQKRWSIYAINQIFIHKRERTVCLYLHLFCEFNLYSISNHIPTPNHNNLIYV